MRKLITGAAMGGMLVVGMVLGSTLTPSAQAGGTPNRPRVVREEPDRSEQNKDHASGPASRTMDDGRDPQSPREEIVKPRDPAERFHPPTPPYGTRPETYGPDRYGPYWPSPEPDIQKPDGNVRYSPYWPSGEPDIVKPRPQPAEDCYRPHPRVEWPTYRVEIERPVLDIDVTFRSGCRPPAAPYHGDNWDVAYGYVYGSRDKVTILLDNVRGESYVLMSRTDYYGNTRYYWEYLDRR